ncbi:MAG TPA: magnesium transporter CorA family protein [Legionella sp.]|nr:magnesium transporter CorA family protein [Legionella sp.]
MIIAYQINHPFKQIEINESNQHLLNTCLWVDLINPNLVEELLVEKNLALDIPSREELREIEISSRLYKEHDVLFMTATMIAQSDSPTPLQDAVTFILTKRQLITIRYIEPQAFKLFVSRLPKLQIENPLTCLTELLDATIDRLADILELISHQLESYSKNIFVSKTTGSLSYQQLLQQLGVNGELNSKIVESLVSFSRLISFLGQSSNTITDNNEHVRLVSLSKDLTSLSDHASFLSNKVSFLLEATLGMVQIEQNAIIKIFSVAAVIFLPPTLIASIYGMNFNFMPELSWKYGYVVAVGLMLVSSWLPYKYFKYRKWL